MEEVEDVEEARVARAQVAELVDQRGERLDPQESLAVARGLEQAWRGWLVRAAMAPNESS